jgi:hypothetical protein
MERFTAPNNPVYATQVDTAILSPQGAFIVYSHDGTNAKIEFLNVAGTVLFTSQIARPLLNRVTPIAFYTDLDPYQFTKGLYFSQSYQAFSVWSSYFA